MRRPVLAFVHGWGQAAQTWHAQADYFAAHHEVRVLSLPGHGGAADLPVEAWDDFLLAELQDTPVVLVGWSLGGMLALRLASRNPQRLSGLVLVSTTPCFRQRPGWEYACADEMFERFQASLEADAPRLLDRFFALMLQGDGLNRKQYLDVVRHAVDRHRPASPKGLRGGLQLLDQLDLRAEIFDIHVPALVVHGAADAVTPLGAAQFLAERMPAATLRIMQSGHAPHLTRPQEFNQLVEEWCLNNISTHAR